MPAISVVVPVYNSEKTLEELAQRIHDALAPVDFELILVNDGSRDNSLAVCRELATRHAWVRTLSFYRNFGQAAAIFAGLAEARGDIRVIIDDDLQIPPESIPVLVRQIEQGYDFAYGVPERPVQSRFRTIASQFTFYVSEALFDKPRGIRISSFLAMRGDVVDKIVRYTGPFPYLSGHLFRITHSGVNIEVPYEPRRHGRSQYRLRRLIRLWLAGVTNNSILPLRLATYSGFTMAILALLTAFVITLLKLLHKDFQAGWPSMVVIITFFSSLQLMALGVIGEYLGRVFTIVNEVPQYAVRERLNPSVGRSSVLSANSSASLLEANTINADASP